MRTVSVAILGFIVLLPGAGEASLWEDATSTTIGTTAGWSNKVELADINGDGLVDILFANGGNYSSPGTPEQNQAFINQGAGNPFTDDSDTVFGLVADRARVVKVRDVDGDGNVDIVVGVTYQGQSRLYLGDGFGGFTEVTATNLPQVAASVGDIALGDVDGDGDIDMLLADWGPVLNDGGRTMLWLNDGDGSFTDATSANMPDIAVQWSWDLELADVDNDYDLDALISCKLCSGSYLFRNDSAGVFTNDATAMPQFSNNYEFEVMDLDGDDLVDLVTINDAPGLRQHVFIADGAGGYTDETATLWPTSENLAADDNVAVFLDYDSDGDADFVIGSLSGSDRLLDNDGSGMLTVDTTVFTGTSTPGTLGLAFADLNGDDKLDAVMSQGEVASPDKVFLGVDIAADTAPPAISNVEEITTATPGSSITVRARINDRKTPTMPHDFSEVALVWSANGGGETRTPMEWYGEHLWRATVPDVEQGTLSYQLCATDTAGSEACSAEIEVTVAAAPDAGPVGIDAGLSPDAGPGADDGDGGCGCRVGGRKVSGGWVLVLLGLVLVLRRRNLKI